METDKDLDLLSMLSAQEPRAALVLENLTFHHKVDIRDLTIKTSLDIKEVMFEAPVAFKNCIFQEELNVFRTVFKHRCSFEKCTFEKIVAIRPARLVSLSVKESVFKNQVEFALPGGCDAQFDAAHAVVHGIAMIKSMGYGAAGYTNRDSIDFINIANVSIEANAALTIAGFDCNSLTATEAKIGDKSSFTLEDIQPKALYLHDLKLSPSAIVALSRVSLARAFFTGTNIEKFRLSSVYWPVFDGRNALWQERWLRTDPQAAQKDQPAKSLSILFEEVAENYRQLVLNYEAQRNYESAEAFHMGEMELMRLQQAERLPAWLGRWRGWLNLHWLYRALSAYGTNYNRAGAILILMLLAFSVIFLFAGIRTKSHAEIEYQLAPMQARPCAACLAEFGRDAGTALALTLAVITLQKDRPAEPIGVGGSMWISLLSVLAPAQAALFVFALRRRFRRASI